MQKDLQWRRAARKITREKNRTTASQPGERSKKKEVLSEAWALVALWPWAWETLEATVSVDSFGWFCFSDERSKAKECFTTKTPTERGRRVKDCTCLAPDFGNMKNKNTWCSKTAQEDKLWDKHLMNSDTESSWILTTGLSTFTYLQWSHVF